MRAMVRFLMPDVLTAQEIWNMFAETNLRMQETDRRMQETDRRMQETDRVVRETSKKIGDLGNRLGEFVEYMVRPAAVRLFRERGIQVHEVHGDVSVQRDNLAAQFDLLVVNDTELVVIECKSKLGVEDVKEHLDRMHKVKVLLPKYADLSIYGAVAAIVAQGDAVAFAEKSGLFVIRQSGDAVELTNPPEFRPREFQR